MSVYIFYSSENPTPRGLLLDLMLHMTKDLYLVMVLLGRFKSNQITKNNELKLTTVNPIIINQIYDLIIYFKSKAIIIRSRMQ